MSEPQESVVRCLVCQTVVLARQQVVPVPEGYGGNAYIEVYACPTCGKKAVLMWELAKSASAEARSWVEEQVRTRGAFFPSDFA